MTLAHRRYWRFNLLVIGVLLALGFSVSFVVPLYARELSTIRFAGFRLAFYVGAQGAIVVYLALILTYIVCMHFADRALRRAAMAAAEGGNDPAGESAR